jgi:hypothetical protein
LQRLRAWLKSLPDGAVIPVRARDWSGPHGHCTAWEYGYSVIVKQLMERENGEYYAVAGGGNCSNVEDDEESDGANRKKVKSQPRIYSNIMYFLYESGKMEYFAIDVLNFVDLVHLKLSPGEIGAEGVSSSQNHTNLKLNTANDGNGCVLSIMDEKKSAAVTLNSNDETTDACSTVSFATLPDHLPKSVGIPGGVGERSKVVVISHGYSEQWGPNYPVIRTLELAARRLGMISFNSIAIFNCCCFTFSLFLFFLLSCRCCCCYYCCCFKNYFF